MMSAKPTIFDVGKFILTHSGLKKPPAKTQMRIYKLLWFCQGWHYGFHDKPLFNEKFEAWKYGPVPRVMWESFRGKIDLTETDFDKLGANENNIDEDGRDIIEAVLESCGEMSAAELMKISHQCDPWKNHRSNEQGYGDVIPDNEIREYFHDLVRKG